MTKNELLKLIDGRKLTRKLALELSIKKWEELKNYWENLQRRVYRSPHYPIDNSCALCRLYMYNNPDNKKKGFKKVNNCPLNSKAPNSCDADCDRGWDNATRGIYIGSRKTFMYGRRILLKKMRAALEEGKSSNSLKKKGK
jgi:hypothetical protein